MIGFATVVRASAARDAPRSYYALAQSRPRVGIGVASQQKTQNAQAALRAVAGAAARPTQKDSYAFTVPDTMTNEKGNTLGPATSGLPGLFPYDSGG